MSDPIRPQDFTGNLFFILEETFDTLGRADGNAYLDRDAGWRATLADVNAERATRVVAPGGTSIAQQVAHTLYYLEIIEGLVEGREPEPDWSGSWRLPDIDAEAWDALRERLIAGYERLAVTLRATDAWDDDRIGYAMGALVHSAYHLGAVRQMLRLA